MDDEVDAPSRKITALPIPIEFPKIISVGIYCRVSSTHSAQLASLAQQASYLTKLVMGRPGWWLADIYLDVQPGSGSNRPEYQRMLRDCRDGRLDLVITKTISRFGRDTLELVGILRELKSLGVAVMFDNEQINTSDSDSEHIVTIIEAFAQAETESRVQNTRWGLEKRAKDGTLGLYKRRCFGYVLDKNGNLQIKPDEAATVKYIFELYLSGKSLVGIIRTLAEEGIASPTGKTTWSKNTLDKLLSNEKYTGEVQVFKTFSSKLTNPVERARRLPNKGQYARYVIMESHPAIISDETFAAVQEEKVRRSNIEVTEAGATRKNMRYSAKRDSNSGSPDRPAVALSVP